MLLTNEWELYSKAVSRVVIFHFFLPPCSTSPHLGLVRHEAPVDLVLNLDLSACYCIAADTRRTVRAHCAAVHTVTAHLPSPPPLPLPLSPFTLSLPLSPAGALRAPVATGHPTGPGQLHQCEGVCPLAASGQLRAGWTGAASGGWGRGGTWIGGGSGGSSGAEGQAL